jgi:hypothetical protein
MQPTPYKPSPAYVMFEARAVEDRAASIEAGCPRFTEVDFALITPAGSKDRVERVVTDWFAHLAQEVQNERYPVEWLQRYRAEYTAWKEGRDLPLEGTALVQWPPITPALLKELLGLRIRTVEELAAANEETLKRIGMGARALKQQAVDWLAASNDIGKVAAKLTAMQVQLEAQSRQIEELVAKNQALAERNNELARQPSAA